MFDQAKADAVLEHVASGGSLRTSGMAPSTVCLWANQNPSFAERYARAMEQRADVHAERIEELAAKVEAGEIAPDAARVAIDARKWTASKLRPKRYGDRVQVDADMRLQIELVDATASTASATLVAPAAAMLAKPDGGDA